MKRLMSMMTALLVPLLCAATARAAVLADTEVQPTLDRGFNIDLATTLILVICSVVAALLLIVTVILAKRNFRN